MGAGYGPAKAGSGQVRAGESQSGTEKKNAARRLTSWPRRGIWTVSSNEPEGRGRCARPFGSLRNDRLGPARLR